MPPNLAGPAALLLLAGLILLQARDQFGYPSYPVYSHQIDMFKAADWLHYNLDESTRAAAFNTGIMGYFSDRAVINLDGVINNLAYEAVQARALFCYMKYSSVLYYIAYDPLMRRTYRNFFGPELRPLKLIEVDKIERADRGWTGSRLTIFREEQ